MVQRTSPEYYAKHKWSILAVLIFMPFMATLDGTIVNVALPVMVKDLHTDMESIQMVVIVYLIAVVASILLFGRLGDIKGKGRLFMFGTVVFTLGSLMAGLSHDLNTLIVARVIEGIGGAAAMANNQGIITEVFPSNERGRALGISGIAIALGTMLGPPLGGLIVTYLNWNYIFLINVPIGVIGFLLALRLLPRGEKTQQKVDYRGAVTLAAAVILFFFALLTGENVGYDKYYIILCFVAAAGLVFLFLYFERRRQQPIVDLSLFKNPLFTLSIICVLIQFFALSGISIIQPFYIEDVLKINPGSTGLVMMSLPIAMGIMSPISGYISDKVGAAKVTLVGLVIMTAGLALLATMTATEPVYKLVIYLCIVGLGAGIFSAPNTSLIMSTAPKEKLGITGSINAFTRNFGSVTGIALLTTLLYSLMSAKAGHHVEGYVAGRPDIFVYGMQTVYTIGVIILAVSVVLTVVRLFQDKKQKKAA
ncbi:MAG: MFS transporter [Christensenella sp.]|uniref:MFS transporter n=1 Tax=Christensenella sp. TaxID=1935934 RepID=UPI002B21B852|nr:MFS transporter [Christensenella sp.]MEA5003560.1 MFS transporter [Christensenella sp.]